MKNGRYENVLTSIEKPFSNFAILMSIFLHNSCSVVTTPPFFPSLSGDVTGVSSSSTSVIVPLGRGNSLEAGGTPKMKAFLNSSKVSSSKLMAYCEMTSVIQRTRLNLNTRENGRCCTSFEYLEIIYKNKCSVGLYGKGIYLLNKINKIKKMTIS